MSGKGGKPRKSVGVKGPNPHLKDMRRREAAERQEAYDKLSIKEKIARLDERGLVAKKVRAKLAKQLARKESTSSGQSVAKTDENFKEFLKNRKK